MRLIVWAQSWIQLTWKFWPQVVQYSVSVISSACKQTAQSPEISLRMAWRRFLKKADWAQSRSSCAENLRLWGPTRRRSQVPPKLAGLSIRTSLCTITLYLLTYGNGLYLRALSVTPPRSLTGMIAFQCSMVTLLRAGVVRIRLHVKSLQLLAHYEQPST